MLYRVVGEYEQYISRFGYACSTDGFNFERKNGIAFKPTEGYEKYGIEDPRLVTIESQICLSYVVLSNYVANGEVTSYTALASASNFHNYTRLGVITSR